MDYVVVSDSKVRSKMIFNFVKEYLDDLEGTCLTGQYDMDYLLNEELHFLFFDLKYFKDYKSKIKRRDPSKVNKLVVIDFEDEDISLGEEFIVINGSTSLEEMGDLLSIEILDKMKYDLEERDESILFLLSIGYSNLEIGKKLYLSEKTIKNNLTRLYKVLGVNGRYQAITKAQKLFKTKEI